MGKLTKRAAMKSFYTTRRVIDHIANVMRSDDNLVVKEFKDTVGRLDIYSESQRIPVSVFSATKPKIDPRRARRYHRKQAEKFKASDTRVVKVQLNGGVNRQAIIDSLREVFADQDVEWSN